MAYDNQAADTHLAGFLDQMTFNATIKWGEGITIVNKGIENLKRMLQKGKNREKGCIDITKSAKCWG